MSLTVQQLNADSTFLLSFSPAFAPSNRPRRRAPDYTILVDPWLSGHSSILHPAFQISHHTTSPALPSLEHLDPPPDLILISQDKPDHCHKATLDTFPPSWTRTSILATPAAAKKIRVWRPDLNPGQIHVLPPYVPGDDTTLVRIGIPAYTPVCIPGEITIANLASKRDLTGLHNAIAITYQPAKTVLTTPTKTPPQSPRPTTSTTSTNKRLKSRFSAPNLRHRARADSGLALPSPKLNTEPPLSVVYTPHGAAPSTLSPYISTHLAPLNALPVTALFHSQHREQNPWVLGGVVIAGAPGGVELARALGGVRHWFAAHDGEALQTAGMATAWVRRKRFAEEDVRALLRREGVDDGVDGRVETRVWRLGVGERTVISR